MGQSIEGGSASFSSRRAPGSYERLAGAASWRTPQVVPSHEKQRSTALSASNDKLDQISGKILTGLAYGWSAINSIAVSTCVLSAGLVGLSRFAEKFDRNSSFIENCFRQIGSVTLVAATVGGLAAFVAKKFFRSEEKSVTKPDENAVRGMLTDFSTHAGVGITAALGTLAVMRGIELINPASGLLDKLSRIPMEAAGASMTVSIVFLILSAGISDNVSSLMKKLEKWMGPKK